MIEPPLPLERASHDAPSTDAGHDVRQTGTDDEVRFRVEVIRSARRRRTVGAQMRGDVLRVMVPAWMSATEEQQWVRTMTARFQRRLRADRIDLTARARQLALQLELPLPASIEWKSNMTSRWGSCSLHRRTIGISDRIAKFPTWVVDAVIVHELCHLVVPHHGPEFHTLAGRYPKMERAIGYLMAKGGEAIDDLDDTAEPSRDGTNEPAG